MCILFAKTKYQTMASLYHFTVGMSLVMFVTGQTPFILNATTDQQMAASDNDLLFNITQLFENRTEPVLLNEEGLPSYLTSPIIQLTASQKQELAQHFGPLLAPLAMDAFTNLLCPSTNGRLILFIRLGQGGGLLQLITELRFGVCQFRNPPGSCLDPQTAASFRCHCCVRYRTAVALAVKVTSCWTGRCQLILVKVVVPYCTCCQDPILIAGSTDATELTTTPTTLPSASTEVTKTPIHSTSTTTSYRTTQRSTTLPDQSTRRSTTSATSTAHEQHTTQTVKGC